MITPNKPGVDEIISECLWHIDAEAERAGWDQQAELYAAIIHPLTDSSETATGVIELSQFPGWESSLGVSDLTDGES